METAKNVFAFLGEMWTVSILLVAAYVAAKEIRTRKREKIRAEESRQKKKSMLEETLSIMKSGPPAPLVVLTMTARKISALHKADAETQKNNQEEGTGIPGAFCYREQKTSIYKAEH